MLYEVITIAIGINLVVGLITSLCIIFGADAILHVMNMPESLLKDGHIYLTLIGLCLIPEAAG